MCIIVLTCVICVRENDYGIQFVENHDYVVFVILNID